MKLFFWPCVPGLLLTLAMTVRAAATYYVAQRGPQASDEGAGSAEQPWKTISRAARQTEPGDLVVIGDGIYREAVLLKASGTPQQPIRFQAAPGAHVVVSGADRLTQWQRPQGSRPIYTTPWPYRFITWSQHMTHPDDEYHRLIGRCEQVAIEGYLLRQVLQEGQLAPGTFCADVSNQVLSVWDFANRDLNQVFAEASVRQEILRVQGDYVHVRGLHFRYAANMAQHGAVVLAGTHDVLEDCVIEAMNASGATFAGTDATVRRCTFRDNGQLGFGADGAHRLLFTESRVENNNTKGFARGWEAGGDKLVLCRDATLQRSQFLRNRGNGVWFDIGNEDCTVQQCLIADNEDAGIFYEISFGLHARDNVIVGNGFTPTPGAWGAQAGISLSSSPNCLIERNLLVANREGLNFREQLRRTPRIGGTKEGPVWNHDQLIRHNIIACNRDAQIWGWFDTPDRRYWPAYKRHRSTAESAGTHIPNPDLSLEDLRLRLEENVYFALPSQGQFNWGTTWGPHTNYDSLSGFRQSLGIDTGSQTFDPGFSDLLARDFRLTRPAMDQLKQIYPRGPVPGALLGLLP